MKILAVGQKMGISGVEGSRASDGAHISCWGMLQRGAKGSRDGQLHIALLVGTAYLFFLQVLIVVI